MQHGIPTTKHGKASVRYIVAVFFVCAFNNVTQDESVRAYSSSKLHTSGIQGAMFGQFKLALPSDTTHKQPGQDE